MFRGRLHVAHQPIQQPRSVGIGILFMNTQVQPVQTIYIKATMTQTFSMIVAEVAAMALVGMIANQLSYIGVSFLSNCS